MIEARIMNSHQARSNWRDVLDVATTGSTDVVVERYGRPVVAVIPFEDYAALHEELGDLRAGRQAAAIYEQWKADRSIARPYAEFRGELVTKGVLYEQTESSSLEDRGDAAC